MPIDLLDRLHRDGFALVRGAFSTADCDRLIADWAAACASNGTGVMRNASGVVYGARNILDLWPDVMRVMHQPTLMRALRWAIGQDFGLVRVLYFDKPPGDSWALPWHKDLAIAVRDNRLPGKQFECPTAKYGVPHVEAPEWLLEQMLTARVHLDDVTDENGPLRVVPGSHRGGKNSSPGDDAMRVLCNRGDVLLMRPLLSHCSGHSTVGTTRHRRILHLEFSAVRELPDGYEWNTFRTAKASDHHAAPLALDSLITATGPASPCIASPYPCRSRRRRS
jgi:hypothetical protein